MPNEIYENLFLTPRETEIYNLMLEGLNVKEIARKLYLANCTVATHRLAIYQKKGVNSIQQLLAKRINELENTVRELQAA